LTHVGSRAAAIAVAHNDPDMGIGFKREEFAGFGVSSKERGARTDQSLDIIRRALAGETVSPAFRSLVWRNCARATNCGLLGGNCERVRVA
jgi:hypothetical protein